VWTFKGRSLNRVDAKGRVSLPADFRKVYEHCTVGDHAVLVPMARHKDSIEGFTPTGYDGFLESIEQNDWTAAQKAAVTRRIAGMAKMVPLDDNGRIVLPEAMRAMVGIDDAALFVGMGGTYQIWQPDLHAVFEAAEAEEAATLIAGMDWRVKNR